MDHQSLISSIKTRNPNAVPIGTKFGFLNFGGAGVSMDEHPSDAPASPSREVSIFSRGIFSILRGFLLALIMSVKWSSYR